MFLVRWNKNISYSYSHQYLKGKSPQLEGWYGTEAVLCLVIVCDFIWIVPGSRIEAQLAQHSHQSLLSSSDIFRNLRYFKWTLFCDGNVKLAACAAAGICCSHSRNDSDVSLTPDQSMFFSPTMTRHDIATQIFRELYYF